MKTTRREAITNIGRFAMALSVIGNSLLTGCNLASALNEANNILKLIAPLGDGIAAIVAIANPASAVAVAAASKIYDGVVVSAETFLADWAAASAAAQPGLLAQFQATITALSQDATNLIAAVHVSDATTVAEIATLAGAITSEISALLTVIPQIGAIGGTTIALAAQPQRIHGFYHRSAKSWRSDLVKHLGTPTGKPMDSARTKLAGELTSLVLK